MPRLTDASRDARREEIADSVIRVMRRVGFARLSMAEVFAESGLSAGSVYSHFSSKEDLAVFVLRRAHDELVSDLRAFCEAQETERRSVTPATLTRWLVERLTTAGSILPSLVQAYAESGVESALRTAAHENVTSIRDELRSALEPWAAEREGGVDLTTTIEGVLVVCGGYVSRRATGGSMNVDDYLAAVRLATAQDPGPS